MLKNKVPKTTMPRKGYGRIYVLHEPEITIVKEVIKNMDSFEYEYLPDDLIAVYTKDETPYTVYTHKFDDLDLNELMIRCWNLGVKVFYII